MIGMMMSVWQMWEILDDKCLPCQTHEETWWPISFITFLLAIFLHHHQSCLVVSSDLNTLISFQSETGEKWLCLGGGAVGHDPKKILFLIFISQKRRQKGNKPASIRYMGFSMSWWRRPLDCKWTNDDVRCDKCEKYLMKSAQLARHMKELVGLIFFNNSL